MPEWGNIACGCYYYHSVWDQVNTQTPIQALGSGILGLGCSCLGTGKQQERVRHIIPKYKTRFSLSKKRCNWLFFRRILSYSGSIVKKKVTCSNRWSIPSLLCLLFTARAVFVLFSHVCFYLLHSFSTYSLLQVISIVDHVMIGEVNHVPSEA